ncbi:hypothetical protein JX265_011570 [Neoarthrinium moseri]|uniref:1,3-beta-glucanosyltransferase n=1 Tax=Neoarthrinium moseri TaxID=1658444 RepID=A0A9P9WCH4_9PEZI|nr:uncharacterized protein JN550_011680 [Neoarthrinium moseri]KAI1848576.1 hypothetical protein JX266_005435 [Neoarthrinium moseri]KAI1856611.1 hypothetical protein JX265_011570 [Neoarthrinium moseri]KAI1859996.1 hypothetical protein JN550_011680 [Neoarthrinium moseri]
MSDSAIPVQVRGRYFWKGDERFLLRGVVYQMKGARPNGHSPTQDPLGDDMLEDLKRSLPLLEELRLNTLFVCTLLFPFMWSTAYTPREDSIDHTKSHEKTMKLLADAGIYVIFVGLLISDDDAEDDLTMQCLSTPRCCINRSAPFESYTQDLLQEYFSTIDCISAYSNTLGAILANEVINSVRNTNAAAIIRAVTRDVKKYMALAAEVYNQRIIPVGISSSKILTVFQSEFDYLSGGDQKEALDFFSFNDYSWCGESSMMISGYDRLVDRFSKAHIPVFFSEYGANVTRPRLFHETSAIYSPEMTNVFSGGIVYEFIEGLNRYGLVRIAEGGQLEPLQDFHNLKVGLNMCCNVQPNTSVEWSSSSNTASMAPKMPQVSSDWRAKPDIPESPVDWEEARKQIEDGQWIDVEREIRAFEMEELANSMWGRFQLDGTGPHWSQ